MCKWLCVTWMAMWNISQQRVRWRGFRKVLSGLLIFIKMQSYLNVLMLVSKIMDENENNYKIFVGQGQQQNTQEIICLFWMHSHVNTCYLWCEIKNIFPLDRNTIWSCRWLKHPDSWIYLMISLPPKCLKFYENCESEKAADWRWS